MGIPGRGLRNTKFGVKKPIYKTKTIGGEKNGGERKVRVSKQPKSLQTEELARKLDTPKKTFSQHKRRLRPSITPGTVLILVAGRHKGKRVVFLKQLGTGLLLVTGPFVINGCPMRRINQIYVIATKTKVDISGLEIPERVNDAYFSRPKTKRTKHTEGDIFESKKEGYKVTEERKEDQVKVDKALLSIIKKREDGGLLKKYLGARFTLNNHMYPHKMVF